MENNSFKKLQVASLVFSGIYAGFSIAMFALVSKGNEGDREEELARASQYRALLVEDLDQNGFPDLVIEQGDIRRVLYSLDSDGNGVLDRYVDSDEMRRLNPNTTVNYDEIERRISDNNSYNSHVWFW